MLFRYSPPSPCPVTGLGHLFEIASCKLKNVATSEMTPLARGKRFPRFSYVFASTFVGLFVDQVGLGSGVGINNCDDSCLRVPGSCLEGSPMQGRCKQPATARYEDTCNYDFTIVSIVPAFLFPISM